MSLHRRPVGRGRLTAGLASIILLIGSVPPWWTAGSSEFSLPPASANGFEGAGIAVFLVALATLALITVPYAGDRPVGLDRWWAFAALALVGWAGLVIRVAAIVTEPGGLETITPDRAPGMWITILGLIVLSRAAYDIGREPREH
jgi:hypothetical protein